MNVVVIGNNIRSQQLCDFLQSTCEFSVVCLIQDDSHYWRNSNGDQYRICSLAMGIKLYRQSEDCLLLLSSSSESEEKQYLYGLHYYGVDDSEIYFAPNSMFCENTINRDVLFFRDVISKYNNRRELQSLEIHIADHCNLNCCNCSMLCGLVAEPVFDDFNETVDGLMLLKKHIDHIGTIRILGGEPLLNKRLKDYIGVIRQLFPYSDIRINTNGLLIKSINAEEAAFYRENNVSFIVSCYPSTDLLVDEMHECLKHYGIKHSISTVITSFTQIYDISGVADANTNFAQCPWRIHCATLRGKKLSTCFVPFVFKYLKNIFDITVPTGGTLSLEESNISAETIHGFLNECTPFCSYCSSHGRMLPWEKLTESNRFNKNSWVVN